MASPDKPFRIDVHHHFLPEIYVEALKAHGGDPSGFPTPSWSVEGSLSLMAATRIAHSVISLTAPGVQTVPEAEQPALARAINEAAAAICKENPGRFSFFAALPTLYDPKAAIAEIDYAIDVLGAKGVTFFTRYDVSPGASGSGYLGTAAFRPVWAALNARKAVVFVHPTHAGGEGPAKLINPLLPGPFLDYPHETARTAMDMLASGTKREFSDCKVILSHAGGTLPILLFRAVPGVEMISRGRAAAAAAAAGTAKEGGASGVVTAKDLIADAMTFYFDLALSGSKNVLDTLLRNFPTDRILHGSDFPYAPRPAIEAFSASIFSYEIDSEVREDLSWRNAVKLFPDLADVKL